ncbi:MAG: hypothetical protein E7336_04830 [Clostridiales bacterium]|nr:hypothetical protein [Clostridiales bacterium]
MKCLYPFGFGGARVLKDGKETTATVTDVKVCWWLKINTKPIRANAWDGAVFPHMVHFRYTVNGVSYTGKRYWPWRLTPPGRGEELTISFDPARPGHYALVPR